MSRARWATAALVLASCVGADADREPSLDLEADVGPGGQQGVSLFGAPLFQREDTTGAIARVDAQLAARPDDVELLIAAGRERRNYWQYRQAIVLYTRAIELAPDDWRPYRFRGHRRLSLREFDEGIADLERARTLAPWNWDVAYHLGLAYFFAGRFEEAADEYDRCLGLAEDEEARSVQSESFRSCSQNGDDAESFVAMTEWAVRAAARAGRDGDVARLLASVSDDLDVSENIAYYHDLLFYKGLFSMSDLLEPGPDAPYRFETVGFGVANWLLANGDTAAARSLLEELVEDPWWPGFGRIAAEVELYRLTSG